MPGKPLPEWDRVLSAAARLQGILPGAVLVGGTAAAVHEGHRLSVDADHVVSDLRERFDEVLAQLESVAGWKTARVRPPVLVLGSLDAIETGIRQLIRAAPLETETLPAPDGGTVVVPTRAEMLRIKAILILKRNATRDYLDFAALARSLGTSGTADALAPLDALYPQPNGVTETRAHDELARVTGLAFATGTNKWLSIAYAYDAGDRRTNETWSTGREMAYGYDAAHQLTEVGASRPSDAARYAYDPAGNPVERAELGFETTNAFNNLNQILSGSWTGSTITAVGAVNYPAGTVTVSGASGTIYADKTFDAAGVPVALGANTLTNVFTDVFGRSVTNATRVTIANRAYVHDANGNLTGDGVFSYAYDNANQLTNVVRTADGARVLSARYDALGRRVEATRADGSVERYVYFPGSFLVLAVLDGTNAVKEIYTRGPDLSGSLDGAGGIGGILACTYASGATYCSHADIMGNVITLTDASGSVAATFRYTPFGQLSARTGTILPRYLFSSKEFDRTANLYYYGYRYYAPRLGRWMTRDPFHEEFDMNLYRYAGNSPFIDWDSWGLFPSKGDSKKKPFWGLQGDKKYYQNWLKNNPNIDKRIAKAMKKQIERSCIGITCLNLGIYNGDPEITNCYSTITKAEHTRDEWNANCHCKGKSSNGEPARAMIYAIKLWSKKRPTVDPTSELVDLSDWKITRELKYESIYYFNRMKFPWDFGFFDEESGYVINGWGSGSHLVAYNDFGKWAEDMPINYNMIVYCVSCNTLRSTK